MVYNVDGLLLVGASHQAGPPGQGHENQVPGGDLPVLSAHQGEQCVSGMKDGLFTVTYMYFSTTRGGVLAQKCTSFLPMMVYLI